MKMPWGQWLLERKEAQRAAEDEIFNALVELHHDEAVQVLSRVGQLVKDSQFKSPKP